MPTTVLKYPVGIADKIHVDMPRGAEPLFFGSQGDNLYLWARVTVSEPKCRYWFRMAGTGHSLDDSVGSYINSVTVPPFVWHFFKTSE